MSRKITRLLLSFIVLLVFAGAAHAQALTWQIDPAHTSAYFMARHDGIVNVRGMFRKMDASVTFDPNDLSKTAIEATIDTTSVDSGVDARDKDLKSNNFLDVEKFPTITFKSTSAVASGLGKLKLIGNLTIHGVTREVTLDVDGPTLQIKDDRGNTFMGASGALTINRKDYGITFDPRIADIITIDIEMAMVRRAPRPPAATPAPGSN